MKTPNVQQSINVTLWSDLSPAVAACRANSLVGTAAITLLNRYETLLSADDIEREIYLSLRQAALRQCAVWYFSHYYSAPELN